MFCFNSPVVVDRQWSTLCSRNHSMWPTPLFRLNRNQLNWQPHCFRPMFHAVPFCLKYDLFIISDSIRFDSLLRHTYLCQHPTNLLFYRHRQWLPNAQQDSIAPHSLRHRVRPIDLIRIKQMIQSFNGATKGRANCVFYVQISCEWISAGRRCRIRPLWLCPSNHLNYLCDHWVTMPVLDYLIDDCCLRVPHPPVPSASYRIVS